jgi:hypothetical protein
LGGPLYQHAQITQHSKRGLRDEHVLLDLGAARRDGTDDLPVDGDRETAGILAWRRRIDAITPLNREVASATSQTSGVELHVRNQMAEQNLLGRPSQFF